MIKIFIAKKADTDNAAFIEKVTSLPFGNTEKQRLLSMKNSDAANSSLTAYLALKKLLDGLDCNDLTISRNTHGKPFFEHLPHLPFSISHSGELSVAAICDDIGCQSIGVDIEILKNNINFKKIADRFFGEEKSKVESEDDFLILWTKKEAYSKMRGGALTDVISLPANSADCFKIEAYGKTAYMSVCYEASAKSQEIEIITKNDKISIKKTEEQSYGKNI